MTDVARGLLDVARGQLRLARCINSVDVVIDVVGRLLPSGGLVVVLTSSAEVVSDAAQRWHRACPQAALLMTARGTPATAPEDAVTTKNPDMIATWACAKTAGLRVLVGRHIHADRVGEGLLKAAQWADLLVIHEAHHTAGPSMRADQTRPVHDDSMLPAAARLYTTTAPRIFRRHDTHPADPGRVALSMDDENLFGTVLHEYTADQALTDGLASRFRLVINLAPRTTPPRQPLTTHDMTSIADNDPEGGPDGGEDAGAHARPMVTHRRFCTDRHPQTIDAALGEALLSSDSPLTQDCSPGCCDVPRHTRMTVTSFDTCPSNCPSACPDKPHKAPTVTVPTVTATFVSAADHSKTDWSQVIQSHQGFGRILRALRDWDPAFGRTLDAARAHGAEHRRNLLDWISIQTPAGQPIAADDLLAAVACAGSKPWWEGYGHIAAHHARTGTIVVPNRHVVDGFELGHWLASVRTTYTQHGLPIDEFNAITALGPITDTHRDLQMHHRWERVTAEARTFHARNAHLDVEHPGSGASSFLRNTIRRIRTGAYPVTQQQRQLLTDLGMVWEDPQLLRRKDAAEGFADYYQRHGNLDFPDDHVMDVRGKPSRAVNWIARFREEHRLGVLHPQVRHTLEEAGFVFDPNEAWWHDLITAARRYHRQHGDLDVERGAVVTDAGKCLLTMLEDLRTTQRRRRTPSKVAALDALDPLWGRDRTPKTRPTALPAPPPPAEPAAPPRTVPRPPPVATASERWNASLLAAWRHRNRFGHLLPTTDYRDPGTGLNLMMFLSTQRGKRRNTQKGSLTPEQIGALDAIGMIWNTEAAWREMAIGNVRSYHSQHGHLRVSVTAPYHGTDLRGEPFNIYTTLANLRTYHRKGTLHPDWRTVLDELDYDYGAQRSPLPGYVAELETYHASNGHLDIPADHPTATALTRVNHARQRDGLSDDLRRRLADIGYKLTGAFADWELVYNAVRQFYNENGHLDIPADLRATLPDGSEGPSVRIWLDSQRARLKAGRTSKIEKQKLDAMGYVWDLEEAEWFSNYRIAERFWHEYGHLAVAKSHTREHPDWFVLYRWLLKQRKLHTADLLAASRVALLNRIGMVWGRQPGLDHKWQNRLQELTEFRKEHGHTKLHAQLSRTTDPELRERITRLATWHNTQIVLANRGTLRADRREALTAAGIQLPAPSR